MINWTAIFEAVLTAVVTVVGAVLIPWVKSKTTAVQMEEIQTWVLIAVTAAEQMYKGGGCGAEKFKYVQGFLSARGIKLADDKISAMIEAAVWELN